MSGYERAAIAGRIIDGIDFDDGRSDCARSSNPMTNLDDDTGLLRQRGKTLLLSAGDMQVASCNWKEIEICSSAMNDD